MAKPYDVEMLTRKTELRRANHFISLSSIELGALLDDLTAAQEALEWYADYSNVRYAYSDSPVDETICDRARKALEGVKS